LLQERPEPASRLDAPRSHKDAVVDHDNPDADKPVRPGTGSDAHAFPLAEICQDVVGEMLLRLHVHLIAGILATSPTGD
jgi:hypothetical protein